VGSWSAQRKPRARTSHHRCVTHPTPSLTIPGPAVAELRVRVDVLNKVLAELVGRVEG
jgi:hypothetical protein